MPPTCSIKRLRRLPLSPLSHAWVVRGNVEQRACACCAQRAAGQSIVRPSWQTRRATVYRNGSCSMQHTPRAAGTGLAPVICRKGLTPCLICAATGLSPCCNILHRDCVRRSADARRFLAAQWRSSHDGTIKGSCRSLRRHTRRRPR
jgi:hypothetical protein